MVITKEGVAKVAADLKNAEAAHQAYLALAYANGLSSNASMEFANLSLFKVYARHAALELGRPYLTDNQIANGYDGIRENAIRKGMSVNSGYIYSTASYWVETNLKWPEDEKN